MGFKEGFNKGQLDIISLNKNQVHESLLDIIKLLNNDEKLSEIEGKKFAHILTYFQPPIKKSSDLAFVTSLLLKRKNTYYGNRWKSFAKYTEGIGLHGCDGQRMHILKNFKPDDPTKIYFIPESKKWMSEDEIEISEYRYPDVTQLFKDQNKFKQVTINGVETVLKAILTPDMDDQDHYLLTYEDIIITLKKKYINDIIEVMSKGRVFIKDAISPVIIEDETKKVLIIPIRTKD
jgi:hypothetical protein